MHMQHGTAAHSVMRGNMLFFPCYDGLIGDGNTSYSAMVARITRDLEKTNQI